MAEPRRTSWKTGVVPMAVSALAALGGAEVVIRVFGLSTTLSSYRHPDMAKYSLLVRQGDDRELPLVVPNAEAAIEGIPFRINSRGFRDREFSEAKMPGTVRIVCLGDSVTFALDLPLEASYPKRLEADLRAAGLRVETLNFGAPHFDLPQHVAHYQRKAAAFRPDIVVLQFGLNDLQYAPQSAPLAAESRPDPLVSRILRSSAVYLFAAERYNYLAVRMGSRRPIMDSYATQPVHWAHARQMLGPLFAEMKRAGVTVVLAYFPYEFAVYSGRPELAEPSRQLAALATELEVEFLDVTPDLKAAYSLRRSVFLDDTHLTAWGNEVAARAVGRAVEPLVRRPAARVIR